MELPKKEVEDMRRLAPRVSELEVLVRDGIEFRRRVRLAFDVEEAV